MARYPWTQSSSNHLYASASMLPPIISTISVSSLKSGSQPMLPPGELSNMNPKSGTTASHQQCENEPAIWVHDITGEWNDARVVCLFDIVQPEH